MVRLRCLVAPSRAGLTAELATPELLTARVNCSQQTHIESWMSTTKFKLQDAFGVLGRGVARAKCRRAHKHRLACSRHMQSGCEAA